ncbi:MAG TPA: hypothetical protein VNY24_17715 [Candidatus Acidoferrales bacterium]|nr:hypothetical protein [Candidatus Acidoferrales bacterium]
MVYVHCQAYMKRASLLIFVMVALMTAAVSPEQAKREKKQNRYTAPDGGITVFVTPIRKEAGRSENESRIEFKSIDGRIACAIEYSSEDSEHGFGVVKAEWTPDSQYFVFSLTSSGGHQPWHAPTQFLSRKDGIIRSLDDYFESAGISNSDFRLSAPNTIKTEVWKDKAVPVTVKLDALPPSRSWRKSNPVLIAVGLISLLTQQQPSGLIRFEDAAPRAS